MIYDLDIAQNIENKNGTMSYLLWKYWKFLYELAIVKKYFEENGMWANYSDFKII